MDQRILNAYAIGYYDGRARGSETTYPDPVQRHWYRRGYDAGLADYCAHDFVDTQAPVTVRDTEIIVTHNGMAGGFEFIDAQFYVTLSNDDDEWAFYTTYHPLEGRMHQHDGCIQYVDNEDKERTLSDAPPVARDEFLAALPEIEAQLRAKAGETAFALMT